MSEPLTLARIASEAAERAIERGYLGRTDEDLDVSHEDFHELCSHIAWAHPRAPVPGFGDAMRFQGPSGVIHIHVSADLPAGTWKWRDKNPFARWFPEARS
jgi:hypothetical protein